MKSKAWHLPAWFEGVCCFCLTVCLAFGMRLLEWPAWQNPEYIYDGEMLLATHDAYHWLAGAEGFGLASGHPMAILLRSVSFLTGLAMADAAFWLPAAGGALVAGLVFLWTWLLGGMAAGIAAGLIASIAPGFLARTLLGYYDTDLVTLFFPLLIALGPAWWARQTLFRVYPQSTGAFTDIKWLIILPVSGLLAWQAQEWHSVFPYLIRCLIFLLAIMAIIVKGERALKLVVASLYALPALAGLWGFGVALILAGMIFCKKKRKNKTWQRHAKCWVAGGVWLVLIFLAARGDILNTIINHINAYLKHSGETHSSGGSTLVFPAVAQSIIEVQDLTLAALFPYFHPWMEAALAGFAGFAWVIFRRPAALFLAPLAALGLSSARLGGRMVMFGAPITAIGLALPAYWLLSALLRKTPIRNRAGFISCVALVCGLVAPFLDMIPALSQGPSINRRHAAALAQARAITPENATLWLWWDWGYAAHYFSRRQTIADGARHGGPSLYLPAAVFACENPRFARQIIRRASTLDNEPGNFFAGMNDAAAQELINKLRSQNTALVTGEGRQFLIVSFEMLKLGFWISNFGNWNFIDKTGEGGALSIVPQALSYNLALGEVRISNSGGVIFPASINVFEETGLTRRDYIQEWFNKNPKASPVQQRTWLAARRNINFLFNRVTDEKLAMDAGIYNSLMVQLLLIDAHDERYAPYFKLVYDNVFARIYEVLPAPDDR